MTTCTSIDCPERRSLCCGVYSEAVPNRDYFWCKNCHKEFVGGECTAKRMTIKKLVALWKKCAEDTRESRRVTPRTDEEPQFYKVQFYDFMDWLSENPDLWEE